MNYWKLSSLLMIFILLIAYNTKGQNKKNISDIKKIDFMNYTYSTSITKQFGWNKAVKVKNGEFSNRKSEGEDSFYFGVKVLYGDINHDLIDEAIIIESCGMDSYDWSSTEILIYALKNGKPMILSKLTEKMIENDYKRYYPNTIIWT